MPKLGVEFTCGATRRLGRRGPTNVVRGMGKKGEDTGASASPVSIRAPPAWFCGRIPSRQSGEAAVARRAVAKPTLWRSQSAAVATTTVTSSPSASLIAQATLWSLRFPTGLPSRHPPCITWAIGCSRGLLSRSDRREPFQLAKPASRLHTSTLFTMAHSAPTPDEWTSNLTCEWAQWPTLGVSKHPSDTDRLS